MEALLVIFGLVVLAVPVAVIYLLVTTSGLRRRLAEAEQKLALLELGGVKKPEKAAAQPETGERPRVKVAAPDEKKPDPQIATTRAETLSPPVQAGPDVLSRLAKWVSENWFYVVSAVSLALAGVFLVQYGMEAGLLPPIVRVLGALAFGTALVTGGEYVRKRWGDGEGSNTAYLPSVFTGAGLVTLFGAILSARLLYDMTGPGMAMAGLVAVAFGAMVLGWLHGPLLAAVGVVGAMGAPFVVGGSSDDPAWLFAYFALITGLGLSIDTLRRWAWVSVLTLACGFAATWLLALGAPGTEWAWILYLVVFVVMAILIPARSLAPDQDGVMVLEALRVMGAPLPEFPTRIAFGAMLGAVPVLVFLADGSETQSWLAILSLAGLCALTVVWSQTGRALQDVAVLAALGGLAAPLWMFVQHSEIWTGYRASYEGNPEAAFPLTASLFVALSAGLAVLLARRSGHGGYGGIWAALAALLAPAMAILLEMTWAPADVIGVYPWALHGAALAAGLTFLSVRFAVADGAANRWRASVAALAAMSCMAFALVLVLNEAALTIALAGTVAMAVWLDRRFDLPAMGAFVSAGVVSVGYRLVVEPGLAYGIDGPLSAMLLSYGGASVLFGIALWMQGVRARLGPRVMLETATASAIGLTLTLGLMRALSDVAGADDASHWAMGLYAVIWLMLGYVQLYRSGLGGRVLQYVRFALAGLFGLAGLGALACALTLSNPLLDDWLGKVVGPPLLNTLAIGYLLPGLLIAAASWRLPSTVSGLRWPGSGLAVALSVFWVFCVIRHFWQEADGMELSNGMLQPELYSYTIALLVAGAALFYQSLAGRNAILRRAGLVVIGLAVAKVFLVDISGLQGLTRVFSLLVLGLSLAGLAWLNRWAQQRHRTEPG